MTTTTLQKSQTISGTEIALRAIWIVGFALATALAAQVRIPVPGTIVPVTLQTAIVLLAALRLGARDGAISQALYIALGAAGVPVFALNAGLLGPTGGYLFGFILSAAILGLAARRKRGIAQTWILTFAASLIIFALGMAQLKLVLGTTWSQAFAMGVAPFIVGDIVKVTFTTIADRAFSQLKRGA